MVYCSFCSITAASAHFSRGVFTLRLVERQLVIRPPRKNHDCEDEAQNAVRGKQSSRFRNPCLRHTYQFGNYKSVESWMAALISQASERGSMAAVLHLKCDWTRTTVLACLGFVVGCRCAICGRPVMKGFSMGA